MKHPTDLLKKLNIVVKNKKELTLEKEKMLKIKKIVKNFDI